MKITSCVECIYYTDSEDIDDWDWYCHLAQRSLHHEIGSMYPIPKWCPLPTLESKVESAIPQQPQQAILLCPKCGKGGREHCTTYGVDKKHCDVAARCGDFLKYKVMGWVAAEAKESSQTSNNKQSAPLLAFAYKCRACGCKEFVQE
jgi:hypothetical protein